MHVRGRSWINRVEVVGRERADEVLEVDVNLRPAPGTKAREETFFSLHPP